MDIPDEAVEAAAKVLLRTSVNRFVEPRQQALELCKAEVRQILEAAAPHMLADLIEEWAVQFGSGSVEEAEDEKDARRKLNEIRECIADGIETPALEPMRLVRRYRVASSELTAWKPI